MLEHDMLDNLRRNNPAWRLLCAQHAPLIASFLHRVFVAPNVRTIAQADLIEALEGELAVRREQEGAGAYPRPALHYLDTWAGNECGWLRKFYPQGTDEPHFDLTPATEKALAWLESLVERSFVGTESRLLTLFEILRQMEVGSEADPGLRLAELERRKAALEEEMARIRSGELDMLDDTALRDRFQQFQQVARELLTDFREVEDNFRMLDRAVRERIARGDEGKGALLADIMGERDLIAESDQGRSFRAFWDFLLSGSRQEEFGRMLQHVVALPAIRAMRPDPRILRIHYDWLEAGDHTQRTVAKLSEQLRRFLDDRAWLENRRIMHILRDIEAHALDVRETPPKGAFMDIDECAPEIRLPLERPLFRPAGRTVLENVTPEAGAADVDTTALFSQIVVDEAELAANIRQELRSARQVSLATVVERHPLRHGLAELLAYLRLAGNWHGATVDEGVREEVVWQVEEGVWRRAGLPRVLFARE